MQNILQQISFFCPDYQMNMISHYSHSLDAIKKDRTVIIISHSISQFIDSEIIYVMKNGQVVEHGAHEEVYRQDGTYKEIFDTAARSLNVEKISGTMG